MVDNQHELIKGYRDLTEEEIELINKIKNYEVQIGQVWRTVNSLDSVDSRWAAIARTHLEEGFMALVRSVAKPEPRF